MTSMASPSPSPSPGASPSPRSSPRATRPSISTGSASAAKTGTSGGAGPGAGGVTTGDIVRPRLAFVNAEGQEDARRPSVQFATRDPGMNAAQRSPKPARRLSRRISSPPPPALFQNRVSFDTFDNRDAQDFSLTLNSKHKDYQYTRRSRTFLCGTDQNDYSEFALEWLIDELLDDGDEIVCLRVIDKDSKINSDSSVEEGRYRTEAKRLLDQIIEKNTEDKAISLVLEFAVGKVQDTIQRMIHIYEPAMLIVGTRGRSLGGIQGLLPGSVSKYCLQHSPVPVIVVRPTFKREKKKRKRQKDPTRQAYMNILGKSSTTGTHTHLLDKSNRNSLVANSPAANDEEASAVAAAIGLPPHGDPAASAADMAPITKVQSARSDATSATSATSMDSPSPTDEAMIDDLNLRSPGVVMKSPELRDLDSPAISESEPSDDDDGGEYDGEGNFEAVPASVLRATHDQESEAEDNEVVQDDEAARDSLTLQRSHELKQ